jgi:hypothetical protein
MTPLVIGTREDVAGFALAGIEGVVRANREEAIQAIARADDNALLIVSARMADGGWQMAGGRLVVLPPSAIRHLPSGSS